MTATHGMHYRTGVDLLPHITGQRARGTLSRRNTTQPHWYCDCGEWTFLAKPAKTATGNNLAAAQRAHAAHVTRAHVNPGEQP